MAISGVSVPERHAADPWSLQSQPHVNDVNAEVGGPADASLVAPLALLAEECGRRREQWADTVAAVNLAVRGAFLSGPAFDPGNPAAYQAYWRGVFSWLHSCISTDDGIPTQLASPPVTRFEVRLFDAVASLGCPCCLPGEKPSFVLRNEHGVTKGDLVHGLGKYLFGDTQLPLVYKQDPDRDLHGDGQGVSDPQQRQGLTLPYEAGWMSTYDGVWIFCCPPEQFAKRIRPEIDFESSRQSESGARSPQWERDQFHGTSEPRL